ncbi:dirigent protein 23-like [Salvia hispanica]|uniref:dirigent protein 23-like n=1 Tax=Salvia hispanica TaxID=49212 RepID=UPI0020090232|nr:dirigent protein 23-like [Salvia hispanica]
MASNKIKLSLLITFLAILTYCEAEIDGDLKKTEMTVYYHAYTAGPNTTVIDIPEATTGEVQDGTKFGAMFCTDDRITEGIEEDSPLIARARGIYVVSALDGSHAHMLVSIVFVNGTHKGSTLEVQGSYQHFEPVTETAIVGGTGKFRLARGYATFETPYIDMDRRYFLTISNMTILHY